MITHSPNNYRRRQRLVRLTATLLMANALLLTHTPATEAFTAPVAQPKVTSPKYLQPQHRAWDGTLQKPVLRLQLFRDHNDKDEQDTDTHRTDWHKVAETSGRIARQVGDKVLGALEVGSAKLVDLVSQGAEKVKGAFQEGYDSNTNHGEQIQTNGNNNDSYKVDNDTYDEDLFRGIFVEETQVRMPDGRTRSTYRTTTTFEQEEGEEEDIEAVQDAFIRNQFMADESVFNGVRRDYVVDAISTDEYATIEEVDDGGIEVEIMEGIRRPTIASRNRVVDAEILEKTFM